MNCPQCKKAMQKVRQQITSNLKTDQDLIEYDKTTYHCVSDDVWLVTEIPLPTKSSKKS